MQRVSTARSYLRSTVPGTIRRNSTQSPPTPEATTPKKPAKLTLKGWDDIILPSREEVLVLRKAAQEKAKAKPAVALSKSKTDIGYLKFESNASLAARLARPVIDIQERILREKQEKAAAQGVELQAEEQPRTDPAKPTKLVLSPAEQRRAVRLAREAVTAEQAARKAAKEEQRRTKATRTSLSQTEKQIENFDMIAQSLKSATSPRSTYAPAHVSERTQLSMDSAAKRKAERLERQAQGSQRGSDGDRMQKSHRRESSRSREGPARRGPNRRTKKESEEPTFQEPVEYDGIPGYLPQLTGPPAYHLELTPIRQPALVSQTTRYVPESLTFTPKRADHLFTPTHLVQMVLSHRVDVSVPKRKHALAIVEKFTKASNLSKATA